MPVFSSIVVTGLPASLPVTPTAPASLSGSTAGEENRIPPHQMEPARKPESPDSYKGSEQRKRRHHSENISTPSISGMMQGTELPVISEPNSLKSEGKVKLNEEPFDIGQLILSWKEFAENVDAGQLRSALSVREPVLFANYRVEYNLDNEVQRKRIVSDLKSKLLAHLQKTLHNEMISIEFNVTENLEEILNKPYTDQEKFNALVAKYPVLGLMKNRFGLDFE